MHINLSSKALYRFSKSKGFDPVTERIPEKSRNVDANRLMSMSPTA